MPYTQVTLTQVLQLLKDKVESVPYWTDTEAKNAFNEALRVYNLFTGVWKRSELLVTTAGTHFYTVPSTFVYQIRMQWSSLPLDLSSIEDLNNGRPGWRGEGSSDGGSVPPRPSLFAPAGLNLFAIWPADDVGGTTLVIDSVRETPILVNPGDFLDIGQEDLDALLGYGLHVLSFKEGGARFAATERFFKAFIAAAANKNERLKASTFFRKIMGLDVGRSAKMMRTLPVEAPQGG